MLVLSRKPKERIRIGNGPEAIWITVTEIHRNLVRIGINAPVRLEISREELLPLEEHWQAKE